MNNVVAKLKALGYDTVIDDFYSAIDVWKSWYDGNVRNFHNYNVSTGQGFVQCRRFSAGMAKKVAEDWANLLMNEKVKITLEGEKEQEFFDSVCKSSNFSVKINEMQEMKSALGTSAYVARVPSSVIREDTGEILSSDGTIKLDYVTAPNIFPISWENGIVKECAFTSSYTNGGKKYLYMQIHHIDIVNGMYVIDNILYSDTQGSLAEVDLNSVPGFEDVAPSVQTMSETPLFVIDRLNIANNVDNTMPMGIPAFANAIDQLKGVDIAYDSYVNEFVLGKKRIMVQPSATKTLDGQEVFDPNEVVFYVLPEDVKDQNLIMPIDMNLRVSDMSQGVQDMLNVLSSKCGFGENHYKFNQGGIATATQVISENSTLFRTIKKHEIILESVLIDLCRIILRLGNQFLHMGLNEDVEISIDFDDSIIESREQEEARIYQMLSAGLMRPEEARSLLMNEDEETARKALPGMEDLVDEEQEEVE